MKYPICVPWYASGDDFLFGCDAPKDHPLDEIMAAFLGEEGIALADLMAEERERLAGCLEFVPMYSVVKADWDELVDEGDSGWHTSGSGKRRRDCWWVERVPFSDLIDDINERIQAACPHEAVHASGYWCKACGAPLAPGREKG